jgi:hypothetical protein
MSKPTQLNAETSGFGCVGFFVSLDSPGDSVLLKKDVRGWLFSHVATRVTLEARSETSNS